MFYNIKRFDKQRLEIYRKKYYKKLYLKILRVFFIIEKLFIIFKEKNYFKWWVCGEIGYYVI